jgi:hypothetical protein
MSMSRRFTAFIGVALLGITFLLGFHLGRRYDQPRPVVVTAHPSVHQADGSLVLARQPGVLKPQQQIPAGDAAVDVVRLTVKPRPYVATVPPDPAPDGPAQSGGRQAIPQLCSCKPITVDLSLLKDKAGAADVVASSQDGQILTGESSPVLPLLVKPTHPWAVGPSYGVGGQGGKLGVMVEHDLGPIVVGGELYAGTGGLTSRIHALVRF